MASLFRRNGRGQWIAQWMDHTGKKRSKSTRTSDKAAAWRIARALEASAALRREGVVDPNLEAIAIQSQRPIESHLADFRAFLESRQNSPKHVRMTCNHIQAVVDACQVKRACDLRPSMVLQAIQTKLANGTSLRTCNAYLRSLKSFARWLYRERRASEDTLMSLQGFNEQTDKRHTRREVSTEELTYLLAFVEQDTRPGFNLRGVDRAMLYRVALGTGFRANELRSLTVGSFSLSGDSPPITVKASYSKRRRDDVQPIRQDLADRLRPWLAGRDASERVFASLPESTARMLRHDLSAARAQWIEDGNGTEEKARRATSEFLLYRDSADRVIDFHALRHTYVSQLVAAARSRPDRRLLLGVARAAVPRQWGLRAGRLAACPPPPVTAVSCGELAKPRFHRGVETLLLS